MPIPRGRDCYTLNHYHKNVVQQNLADYNPPGLGHFAATHIWQLVPDIFSLDANYENGSESIVMPRGFEVPKDYVWQEHGYWHIGRSQVMFRKYAEREYYNNDMANQLKLNHMQMTFEPSWHCVPGEDKKGPRKVADPEAPSPVAGVATAAAMGSRWAPSLSLEDMPELAPMPTLPPAPPSPSLADRHRRLAALFSVPAPAPPRLLQA
jgi:hypothetical protein